MLPVKSLDDERFKEIIDNAKKMIPNLTDEWINRSASDPGITFIEMFAYLKEMQQFYLDQISIKNKYKYLKLLGKEIINAEPSKALVTILNVKRKQILPERCKFAAGDIIFETLKEEVLFPININNFYTIDAKNKRVTIMEEDWKEEYYVFGREVHVGNKFYIELNNPIPKNETINISVIVKDEYGIKRNKIKDKNFYPLAKIKWQYYGNGSWKDIEEIEDNTFSFIQSGMISFKISHEMDMVADVYLLRAILIENNYDIEPVITYMDINTINVVQKDTLSSILKYDVTDEEIQSFRMPNYLGSTAEFEVFVKNQDGFFELTYDYTVKYKDKRMIITLEKGVNKKFPIKGPENLYICTYAKEFEKKRNIGICDGFPFMSIKLNLEDICYDDFEIFISRDLEGYVWERWTKIDDINTAGKKDRVYELDLIKNEIIFGDGINGRIPKGQVMVVSYSTTEDKNGNVKSGELNNILWEISGTGVVNYEHSFGGRKALTIEESFKEARKELNAITRAVTDEDYEYIVKSTPGLMINNAKVIIPKENNVYGNTNPNCVYIVVEPYSNKSKPVLNDLYIKNIKSYIEKFRLVTTEVRILSPEYIGIGVYGDIISKSYYRNAADIIYKEIYNYFKDKNWQFGEGVKYSEIYGIIDTLECVEYIYNLSINFSGKGMKKSGSDDIDIPENGMVYLENYEINVSDI